MKRISSRQTFWFKRVFPVGWFGLLAVIVVVMLAADRSAETAAPGLVFVVVPVIMAIIGFVVMKRFVFDLADEVLDGGDHLVVRFRGETERVPLREIIHVGPMSFVHPRRVVLTLQRPGRFGTAIAFSPKRSWLWGADRLIAALVERIDAARRG